MQVAAELITSNGWIQNLPETIPVRAGYIDLHNASAKTITITGLSSPGFERIEIHQSLVQDGLQKMSKLAELVIPAGARIRLKPGSLHMMMINPISPVKTGGQISVELSYADGSHQTTTMTVKK